ncbi:hypothetical protein FJZ17_04090, partial [Candidatus Pacearchaeota archaeon]|nr:hypothetical protein [Candidatus Pacearchaeota archaeon]
GVTMGVWYPGFTGIIAVGDPLMKIYDFSYLNNSKKLLGQQCSEDNECLSERCSADINGEKFCYNPLDGSCLISICNSSNLTKYTYSSECQSKTYLLDGFITVDNGYSKCTSLSKIATCINSTWVLSSCNNGQKCQPGFLYNSCGSKIACNDFCGNQRSIGETCTNSSECANYGLITKIPSHCSSDIFGVSRCHFDKNACIVNETGETIASDHYYCLNSSTRILCSLGNWSLTSNCEFGCSNGFCNFNNAEEFVFDSLEPGQYALYVIPLIPEKNKVSSLFGTFIEFGDTLIIWNVGDFGSVELGKIRGSSLFTLNMPEFWWADKIVSGRLGSTLSSTVSNKSLEIGEAFSIYFSENKKTPNLLKITGIKSPYKQTLTISGSRMMTILDCSEEYNSSRVLREINSIGGNCTKLGKLLLNGSYSYFDLNVIVQEDFSLKKGYGYVLICDAMQPINWTPSCSAYSGCEIGANCGQNGFYGPSFCRGNQLIKNYINFTCNTFGRSYGSCSNSSSELVLETCNYGCNSSMGECNPFVRCSNNLDCGRDYSGQIFCQNSFRSLNQTSFVCNNPGTALSYCSNSTSKVDLEYCPTGCNLNKECNLPINCSSNFDCPGAVLVDDPFCWEGSLDSYQLVSECVNPGLPGSFCSSRKQQITIKKCEPNYFGEWSNSFCYDNSIFRNRETIIRECSSEILDCLHESRVETEIIETCFYGCSSSSCSFPFQCFSDSDCVSENKCSIGSCVNAGTIESSCSYSPLSDGSSCGENQKCFSGNCKKVGRIINDSLLNFTIFIDSRIDPENDFYGSKKIEFNFSQSKIVEFFHNFSKNDLDLRLINIKKGISSVNRTFAIINSLNISSKTLYLNRAQNNSNAVCIADRENLNNETDILLNCSILPCPGSFGNYNCSIENNFFIISGLKHSGVLEYLLYCGDNICNNGETCASCSKDCGACSNGGSGDSGAGSSGGGGGGSSGSSSVGSSGNNSSGNSNKCLTNWNCSEWQNCIGGRQIRTCAKEKLDCEVSSPAIIERTCDTENNQTINLMPFKKFSVNNSYWYIIGIIVFVGIIILISWIIISISRKIAILKESSRE